MFRIKARNAAGQTVTLSTPRNVRESYVAMQELKSAGYTHIKTIPTKNIEITVVDISVVKGLAEKIK